MHALVLRETRVYEPRRGSARPVAAASTTTGRVGAGTAGLAPALVHSRPDQQSRADRPAGDILEQPGLSASGFRFRPTRLQWVASTGAVRPLRSPAFPCVPREGGASVSATGMLVV